MVSTITINRQDTYARTINLTDSDGVAIDATGWTIYFTVRKNIPSTSTTTDTDADISKTIAGDVSGIQTLTLSSSDTDITPGTYWYDFEIKKTDDTISSSTKFPFVVKSDITRTT